VLTAKSFAFPILPRKLGAIELGDRKLSTNRGRTDQLIRAPQAISSTVSRSVEEA